MIEYMRVTLGIEDAQSSFWTGHITGREIQFSDAKTSRQFCNLCQNVFHFFIFTAVPLDYPEFFSETAALVTTIQS